MNKTKAAVLVETGKPLVLTEIGIPDLKDGQVLVEISYSGVCHTQILEVRGYRGEDKYLPHCLGHEGSGVVKKIGKGVTKVKPGDKVILSWMKGEGNDVPGTVYDWNGKTVNSGAITTFSNLSIISENRLTVIDDSVSTKQAALLGCAVATGLGSVFNVAKPKKGNSIAVFGTGGIGLFAINAAQIQGCSPVIAVDINDEKLELAKKMGATHTINSKNTDAVEEIKKICPGGLDYSIESSGVPKVMVQAISSLRNQGGTAVIIGNAKHGEMIELDPKEFNMGKRVLGTWGGDNVPQRDFPKYISLLKEKKLKLDLLISKEYSLDDINQAIDDLESGKTIRPLIKLN
ncbi:zinc-binding dehydrogenase [Candidatus Woesearchaeota archaeon]|nr:zinc-binding dehydrogenase [Candidatus Woesearchaeota archaeon]